MRKVWSNGLMAIIMLTAGTLFVGTVPSVAKPRGEAYGLTKQKARTDTIAVPDMQCGSCEKRITGKLQKVVGISKITADAEAKHVVVTYDPKAITLQEIEK